MIVPYLFFLIGWTKSSCVVFSEVRRGICDEGLGETCVSHERLQIPHDTFQLALTSSHLLPQSGFAGAASSDRAHDFSTVPLY